MIPSIKQILAFLFSIVLLFSCDTKKNNVSSEVKDTTHAPNSIVYEHIVTEVVPNQSEIHFDNAIVLFNEKKYSEASKEIMEGSTYLEKEANEASKEIIENSRQIKKYLNALALEVKKGKIKSSAELQEAFEKVAFKMAHNFFLKTEILLLNNNYDSISINMEKGDIYLIASSKYAQKKEKKFKNLTEKTKLLNSKLKNETASVSKELKDEFKQFFLELKKLDGKLEGPVPI